MAFRALLVSKSPDTNAAMTAACKSTGIRVEACSDIFTAIENAKTRSFSCVIADWADQPEASFLLKRARESASNRSTVAVAIVDHEPTAAEMSDNRLDFLIYRPISSEEAQAVLAKASEKMQPASGEDAAESSGQSHASDKGANAASGEAAVNEHSQQDQSETSHANTPEASAETATDEWEEKSWKHGSAIGLRKICAVALVLVAAFCLWRSRGTIEYLSHTPEGRIRVLKESVAALFYVNQTGALPVSSAGSDAQQDAYFSRGPANSNVETPALGVAATESTIPESRMPLPKPSDFPLPTPVFEHQEQAPIHVQRAAIPESMRNSPPIERPVVVTVTPAQMMPVSAPQSQSIDQQSAQQFSEPVSLTEQAARAMLVQTVDPVYPPEGLAQKLHGMVVLQAVIGRDGGVDDLKIVRGNFVLSRAAIAAVKQWKFQPYSVNGHAASTQTVITINFNSPQG
ncbi:MAG: TonB family protein [Terriglobales bacterium]